MGVARPWEQDLVYPRQVLPEGETTEYQANLLIFWSYVTALPHALCIKNYIRNTCYNLLPSY